MSDLLTTISLVVAAVMVLVFTGTAIRDVVRRQPIGVTFKRWARRTLDAIFSVP